MQSKKIIEEKLLNLSATCGSCPFLDITSAPTDFVDFRDLLLEPQAAGSAGRSVVEPYGDVMPSLFSDFTHRFIALDENGLPNVNSGIRNATTAHQSNVEGRLNITEPFAFSFAVQNSPGATSLVSRVDISSKSISVSNLDSIVSPLQVLDVVGAHRLANSIHLGQISGRPLMLSTDLLFQIEGENSPLAVSNLFQVTLSFQGDIEAVILATLVKKEFLEFPLQDLANPWCWLAALPAPELDQAGKVSDQAHDQGLHLKKFGLSIMDLDLNLRCISCTSYGGEALSEMVFALRESGTFSLVQERLQTLLGEMARNYWVSFEFDSRIVESRKACPYSPYYDSSVHSSFLWPGFPSLSREATESMIIFAALAVILYARPSPRANSSVKNSCSFHMRDSLLTGVIQVTQSANGHHLSWTRLATMMLVTL